MSSSHRYCYSTEIILNCFQNILSNRLRNEMLLQWYYLQHISSMIIIPVFTCFCENVGNFIDSSRDNGHWCLYLYIYQYISYVERVPLML